MLLAIPGSYFIFSFLNLKRKEKSTRMAILLTKSGTENGGELSQKVGNREKGVTID